MKWPLILLIFFCPAILRAQENTFSADSSRVIVNGQSTFLLPEITINNERFPDMPIANGTANAFSRLLRKMNGSAFAQRGLSSKRHTIILNGLLWNEPESGDIDFNSLSLFYRTARISAGSGLESGTMTNGGLNGWSNFNINPLNNQRRILAGYTLSNGDYKHAITLSYHSGRLHNNWAIDFALSNKWAQEGYVTGTFFQKQGYLFALAKSFSPNHHIVFTAVGNAENRSFSARITKETKALSGTAYYNPYWGFQSSEKRNPNTLKSFVPAAILNYEGRLSGKTKIMAAFSYQNGYTDFGGLDWHQAPNPRPDYYKNLPSYYFLKDGPQNNSIGAMLSQQWQEQPQQLDWAYFYAANRMNAQSALGEQNALYVLSKDRHKISRWRAALSFSQKVKKDFKLHGGFQLVSNQSNYFQELTDLLGGAYFVNLNQFAGRSGSLQNDWQQFDLKNPDRKIKEGDTYHYHYLAQTRKGYLWLNARLQQGDFDFWAAGDITGSAYQRTGYYQNGVFPGESFGASGWQRFLTAQLKAGIGYHINKTNQLTVHAAIGSDAPEFDNIFFAPKIRNTVSDNLKAGQFKAIDISWQINHPNWQSHLNIFRSVLSHQTTVLAFYHDDYQSFVHMLIQGIASRQTGIEYTLSAKPLHWFSVDILGGWLQSFYTSRPKVSVFRDNDTMRIEQQETVYWKNYIAASGPQTIVGLRLNVSSKSLGFLSLSGSWQDRSFVSLNPVRHTAKAVYFQSSNPGQFQAIIGQEKLPAFYLVSLRAGKTFRFRKSRKKYLKQGQINLLAGINNLLNNRDYALYGSEQLRFDMDSHNPDYFPNKYSYGYGRTYFISLQYCFE